MRASVAADVSVTLVVHDVERLGGFHDVLVQVREHLLDAVQVLVREQDYGDGVRTDGRIFHQGSGNAGGSMLSIVDDKLVSEPQLQDAQVAFTGLVGGGLEHRLRFVGGGDGREEVIILIFEDVVLDFWNTSLVENSLLTVFWPNLVPVRELEHVRDGAHRHQARIVRA